MDQSFQGVISSVPVFDPSRFSTSIKIDSSISIEAIARRSLAKGQSAESAFEHPQVLVFGFWRARQRVREMRLKTIRYYDSFLGVEEIFGRYNS
jgi:hypothetical protein